MDEDEEEEEISQRRTLADPTVIHYGPRKMNAFDLINMVGGAAMNRMFIRGLGGKGRQVKTTQFTSTAPGEVLLARLGRVLGEMEDVESEVNDKYAQVRAVKEGDRGQVALCAQVYEMTPALFMVECRKTKGDMFFYYDFYRDIQRRMEALDQPGAAAAAQPGKAAKEEQKAEEGDTVIKAGTRTLTISRPGSGSGSGLVGTGTGSGSGSAFRGKLSILITPNTPVREGPEVGPVPGSEESWHRSANPVVAAVQSDAQQRWDQQRWRAQRTARPRHTAAAAVSG